MKMKQHCLENVQPKSFHLAFENGTPASKTKTKYRDSRDMNQQGAPAAKGL